MRLVKFSTKKLNDYDVIRISDGVNIILHYSDSEKPYILTEKFDTSKVHHWNFSNVGNLGWITFYEISEVFHIPTHEKEAISKARKPKAEQNSNAIDLKNISHDDEGHDYDGDIEDLFKDF